MPLLPPRIARALRLFRLNSSSFDQRVADRLYRRGDGPVGRATESSLAASTGLHRYRSRRGFDVQLGDGQLVARHAIRHKMEEAINLARTTVRAAQDVSYAVAQEFNPHCAGR